MSVTVPVLLNWQAVLKIAMKAELKRSLIKFSSYPGGHDKGSCYWIKQRAASFKGNVALALSVNHDLLNCFGRRTPPPPPLHKIYSYGSPHVFMLSNSLVVLIIHAWKQCTNVYWHMGLETRLDDSKSIFELHWTEVRHIANHRRIKPLKHKTSEHLLIEYMCIIEV